jgi:hypothetical protein
MMFAIPARAVVTKTTGPGSSNRYTCVSGNVLFLVTFIFAYGGVTFSGAFTQTSPG